MSELQGCSTTDPFGSPKGLESTFALISLSKALSLSRNDKTFNAIIVIRCQQRVTKLSSESNDS